MSKFIRKHKYSDEDMQDAINFYMDLYKTYYKEMPISVREIAEKFNVPISTLNVKLHKIKKKYNENSVINAIAEDANKNANENLDINTESKDKNENSSEIWQKLADDHRKRAVITLGKEYSEFQEDSLNLKLKLKNLLLVAISIPEKLDALVDQMQISYVRLLEGDKAGDALASEIIKGQKALMNILAYYASPKAIKEMAQAQEVIETIIAKQFGLLYGTASEMAKLQNDLSRTELNKAHADKVKNGGEKKPNTFDYSSYLNKS